jgi:Ni,Fe-hydrogenase I cytochrome b subunit
MYIFGLYDYLALWGMTVITVCIIMLTGLLYIRRYFSSSSEVSIYSQIYMTFIPLSKITFDKLVISRENSKIFTYVFCKSGALQLLIFSPSIKVKFPHILFYLLLHIVNPYISLCTSCSRNASPLPTAKSCLCIVCYLFFIFLNINSIFIQTETLRWTERLPKRRLSKHEVKKLTWKQLPKQILSIHYILMSIEA